MNHQTKHSDNSSRTLNAKERKNLRHSIENTILNQVFTNEEENENSPAYLRLVHAADIANKESGYLLQDAVHQARRINHSWAAIGNVLGISRQAAQQRFNPNTDDEDAIDMNNCRKISGAHAFNEMALLDVEGKAGNHLIGFGPLYLLVQESDQQWEHKRITNFSWQNKEDLESKGWTYIGAWLPFLYYKRPIV